MQLTDETIRDWRETDEQWYSGVNRLRVVCDALLELREAARNYDNASVDGEGYVEWERVIDLISEGGGDECAE